MNLNPTVRWLLGGVAAVVAFLAGFDPFGLSDTAQGIVACLAVLLAALGIVPPQVGGTQQGVVNPSVVEPPNARVDERGEGIIGIVVLILLAALVYWLLAWLIAPIVGIIGAILVLIAGAGSYSRW